MGVRQATRQQVTGQQMTGQQVSEQATAQQASEQRTRRPAMATALDRPDARLVAAAGAVAISLSAVFVVLAHTSASTATFFRCALALPMFGVLAFVEHRRRRLPRAVSASSAVAAWWPRGRWHLLAGVFLGADMVLWSESIANLGAGIATVMVNVQVVVVPLVSLLFFRERVGVAFFAAAPLLLGGVALAGGIGDPHAYGPDPWYGTVTGVLAGIAYAGYLVLLRRAGSGNRMSVLVSVTVGAGAVAVAAGIATGTLELAPGWAALGWLALLAFTGQVLGWALIGAALPRLSASTGSTLLLIQPVAAVGFGVLLLAERPSPLQLAGCAFVLLAVCVVVRLRRE